MNENKPDKPTSLGRLMKKAREEKGWSFARFSEETERHGSGLSQSYLFRLENGERKDPTTQSLKVIIKTLELPFMDVMEAVGMENFLYEETAAKKRSKNLALPEGLMDVEISLLTSKGEINLSEKQKTLLGEWIVDLYEITLGAGDPTYFENNATSYVLRLGEILENDLYYIEGKKEGIHLIFDVGNMIRKYKISKKIIQSEVEKLNFSALSNAGSTFPLILAGESWMANKEANKITIQDKISEITKSYRI